MPKVWTALARVRRESFGRLPSMGVALVAVMMAVAVPASAAVPARDAVYKGRTSQGPTVSVYTDGSRNIDTVTTDVTLSCQKLPSFVHSPEGGSRVARNGTFARRWIFPAWDEQDLEFLWAEPVVVDGVRRSVFALYREHVRGRFTSQGRVGGTWRIQILLIDRAADWAVPELVPLDRCDSGEVAWGAVRQR